MSFFQYPWSFVLATAIVFAGLGGSDRLSMAAAAAGPNVLLICVDDLRPQLGCYGCEKMVTPSLDRLAKEGRRFVRHYVQVPTCGASRLALLTGQYPSQPQAYDNNGFATLPREESDRPVSIADLFRRNGYTTMSIGKISHSPDGRRGDGATEVPFSWDEVGVPTGQWKDGWAAFFGYADGSTRVIRQSPMTEQANVSDDGYPDGLIAQSAIDKLRKLKDQRFFLAVGFFKPHLPFNAPGKYWDYYEPDQFAAIPNPKPPKNVDPAISLHHSGELTPRYSGLATPGVVTIEDAAHLRHAYAACVSYVDAQIGRVLDELDQLGLRDNTIVVVWGDHGWHLGEHGIWGKHTLHDVALHSPLLVRLPQMTNPGEPAEGLVETIDLYPTLAELCDLTAPDDLNGVSFAPVLNDPHAPGKQATFGFWAHGRAHTIRTDRYRFTLWTAAGDPSRVAQVELYDHQTDPHEMVNIADQYPDQVRELTERLRAHIASSLF